MMSIWERIQTGLIVVHYESLDELKRYRDAIRDSGLNVNNCEVVAVVDNKKEREVLSHNSLAVFISEKDFNVLGKLKNAQAQKLMGRKYDLVVFVGEAPKRIRKALARTTGMIRVGLNDTNADNHVNLETSNKSASHLINFACDMLKKIS